MASKITKVDSENDPEPEVDWSEVEAFMDKRSGPPDDKGYKYFKFCALDKVEEHEKPAFDWLCWDHRNAKKYGVVRIPGIRYLQVSNPENKKQKTALKSDVIKSAKSWLQVNHPDIIPSFEKIKVLTLVERLMEDYAIDSVKAFKGLLNSDKTVSEDA